MVEASTTTRTLSARAVPAAIKLMDALDGLIVDLPERQG